VPEEKRKANLARLIDLAKEEVDPAAPLRALSHAIRDGGNLGAHFDTDKEPDEAIARQIIELLEYLISYLYVLPSRIVSSNKALKGRGNAPVLRLSPRFRNGTASWLHSNPSYPMLGC
jgi:hypothetical protein